MAMTHDYLDYLNQRVGIAPANSQEELQAAEAIAALMGQHDVEPQIEEFDAPLVSGLGLAILSILMFVGVLVSGFGMAVLALVGFVLALVPTALVVLRLFGHEPSLSLGPQARSQNVVAVHRATGPLVTKGSRPIVVVAHYDTPRENFLYYTPIAPYVPLIAKASKLCRYVVALCAFVQLLVFVPAPARVVFWIVGILASLPSVLLAVGAIHERVSSCTLGANDNKAGVASLLGVMENVRPSGLVPTPREPEQSVDIDEPEDLLENVSEGEPEQAAEVPVASVETLDEPLDMEPGHIERVPVRPVGPRRGAELMRELGILPEDCEIEYVEQFEERYVPPRPRQNPLATDQAAVAAPVMPVIHPEPSPVEEAPADAPLEHLAEPEEPAAPPIDVREKAEQVKTVLQGAFARVRELVQNVAASRGGSAQDEPDGEVAEAQAEPAAQEEPSREDAPTPVVPAEEAPIVEPTPETEPSVEAKGEPVESERTLETAAVRAEAPEVAPAEEAGTAPMAPVSGEAGITAEDLLSTGRFSIVMSDGSRGVGPKDSSGLTNPEDNSVDLGATQPTRPVKAPRPAAPEDPEWGKASFRPSVSNVARRASLFDLPDPLESESDPLGSPSATRVAPAGRPASRRAIDAVPTTDAPAPAPAPETGSRAVAPAPVETLSDSDDHKSGGLFGRLKGLAGGRSSDKGTRRSDWLGSDDESEGGRTWRGGAAARSGLRLVEGDSAAPSEEELREAALSLGDDALVAHDIWFVALGGSHLDHAGMRAFLDRHRRDVRGSFVINLSCVGAGSLSILTHEGLEVTRRADRRLGRIVSNVARDLHVELGQKSYDWSSTDAHPAMRASMRALTIMGLDESGMPALSRTPMDVSDNVSGDQATLVTEIVTEAIRRS